MSIENNFFATDSCEWSNANYSECLCPLPQCPVSHFRFLSACRDDLDWKLHDSRIVPPPWSRLTFLPRLAVTWMLVWHPLSRPFDPRWIRVHPTSPQLSLFLFYILRHKVCSDCTGISGMVCGLCMDCWIAFVLFKMNKLCDCWSHLSNLTFTYVQMLQLLIGCPKMVSTDNTNKSCKGDEFGVFFVIVTATSWLADQIAVYPLTSC